MLLINLKRVLKLAIILIVVFSSIKVFAFFSDSKSVLDFSGATKVISVNDNGVYFETETAGKTVAELLEEKQIRLEEYDRITPERGEIIYPGASLQINRAVKVEIVVDGKTLKKYVLAKTVKEALQESEVILSRLDRVSPEVNAPAENNLEIVVTRINVEDINKKEAIDFKTVVKTDSKMGWQDKKIEIIGVKGEKEVKYRVTYKDGKEVSRVKLETTILSKPITQVEVQGTYMKLGKADKGQGTWDAWKGGMFAASTTIPKGSYAKVTNTANGKSVVVQINDYGPQGKGRIIDLDKVAFQKLASIGAGVIGVKVEQVLN
jgi:uncharacterized protein YabE (DUF348 family)